jgi:hypothetical protein
MVSLSIRGMTGRVNPFFLAMRRPGTLSVVRRRFAAPFFVGKSHQRSCPSLPPCEGKEGVQQFDVTS